MAEISPPAWCEQGSNHARSARLLSTGIAQAGVWGTGDLAVSTPSGLNLNVAAGGCWVTATTAGNGAFACYNDATKALTVATGGGANRVDIVVAQVRAREFGDSTDDFRLLVVDGTSTAPNPPATPSNAYLLANVAVNAGASTIASVTDKRTGAYYTMLSPTIRPFAAGQKGMIVKGQASQAANLTEWQSSAGTALASVGSAGQGTFADLFIGASGSSLLAFTAYTPSWLGATTNPTLGGNGTITGRYVRVGGLVYGQVRIAFTGAITAGSGSLTITLPATSSSSALAVAVAGSALWTSASGSPNRTIGVVRVPSSSTIFAVDWLSSSTTGDTNDWATTAFPANTATANGDAYEFSFLYEAA